MPSLQQAQSPQIPPDDLPPLAADLYRRLAATPRPVLGLFQKIADAWGLDRPQRMALMGLEGESRYHRWFRDPASAKLTVIHAERLSQVSAIAEHLHAIYAGTPARADAWPTHINDASLFGGQVPIRLMGSGPTESLIEVRRHLAARRHR